MAHGEDDAARPRVDGVAPAEVERVVGAGRPLLVEPVEPERREERPAAEREAVGDLAGRPARGLEREVEVEAVRLQAPAPDAVDVAEREVPERVLGDGVRRAEELEDRPRPGLRGALGGLEVVAHGHEPAVGRPVLVGDREHLVLGQARRQREPPELGVDRVVDAVAEEPEHVVVDGARGERPVRAEEGAGPDGLARGREAGRADRGEVGVGVLVDGGVGERSADVGVARGRVELPQVRLPAPEDGGRLAEVGQGDGPRRLLVLAGRRPERPLVLPHLDADELAEAGLPGGAGRERDLAGVLVAGVPPVVEGVAEEEVRVVLVLVRGELERLHVGAARDRLLDRLGVLLGGHGRERERAELEVGAEPEQPLAALDERRRRLEEHVARLDALEDVVVVALVDERHLVLELELALRVVVDVDRQLVADRAGDVEREVLAEVGVDGRAGRRLGGLEVALVVADAEVHVRRAVDGQRHLVLPEQGAERALLPARDLDGEAEPVPPRLALRALGRERPERLADGLLAPGHQERGERDVGRRPDVARADDLADAVAVGRRVERDLAAPVRAQPPADAGQPPHRERRPAPGAERGAEVDGGPVGRVRRPARRVGAGRVGADGVGRGGAGRAHAEVGEVAQGNPPDVRDDHGDGVGVGRGEPPGRPRGAGAGLDRPRPPAEHEEDAEAHRARPGEASARGGPRGGHAHVVRSGGYKRTAQGWPGGQRRSGERAGGSERDDRARADPEGGAGERDPTDGLRGLPRRAGRSRKGTAAGGPPEACRRGRVKLQGGRGACKGASVCPTPRANVPIWTAGTQRTPVRA